MLGTVPLFLCQKRTPLRFIALSIPKGPETFPALSFYPPKRVLLVLAPVHP